MISLGLARLRSSNPSPHRFIVPGRMFSMTPSERALAAGARRIEATSFVNPKRVPQMADAEAVMASLPPPGSRDGVSYIGLALNERGVRRAIDARVDEVNFVVIATETFNQRNQG